MNSRRRPWKSSTYDRTLAFGDDRDVARQLLEIGRHRFGRRGLRRRPFERRHVQEFVDGGRLGTRLRDAVGLAQRQQVEGRDAIEQPLERRLRAGIAAGALRQPQQQVDRRVEVLAGSNQTALVEFSPAQLE